MYLLEYLKTSQHSDSEPTQETVEVEFRLACSGELYDRSVIASDWRKSDITRVLLREPFELFVVGQFDDYPQELCARLKLSYVTEERDSRGVKSTSIFLPDDEIVEDLCSILSLLARRLISVVGKIRERRPERNTGLGSYGWDAPVSILNRHSRSAVWSRRPITIKTNVEGQHLEIHDSPPAGVDSGALGEFLLKLPDLAGVEEIIHTCRLYKTALELIESRPDITYQLLISAVETMTGVALHDYQPEEAARLSRKPGVLKSALACGLNEEQAKGLALEACRDERWIKQKFKKFILDNVSAQEVDSEDPVFPWWSFLRPARQNFEKVLGRIYDARSSNLHRGYPFPRWVGLGTGPTADARSVPLSGLDPDDVPPVTWFERVVSAAVRGYLVAQCSVDSQPFSDFRPSADQSQRQ